MRYVPAGSLCTASAEQIFPRDSVQRNCFELALYTARDHDCISNRIGSGIRSAMQMSSRYVRCAPNAVDDRTDHHADRSSTSGPHRRRCHRSIHCCHSHAARRSALPRERFSPSGQSGKHMLGLSSSQFDPERTSPFARVLVRTSRSSHQWRVAYQRSIGFLAAGPTPRGRSELFRQAAPLKSLPNRDLNW